MSRKNLVAFIRYRIRTCITWIWLQEGTPGQRARGIAAGVFSGCLPLFGLQSLIGLAIAKILRGNSLLAVGSTLISNPITYLPIYWFNYIIGCFLMRKEHLIKEFYPINLSTIINQGWEICSKLIVGSIFVGVIAGGISGGITYKLIKIYLRKKT